MDRRDLGSLEDWLSMGTNRMEAATEDRAALVPMIGQAISRDRAFVMHELVFGHSAEWRARSGRTQLEYYDTYLQKLLDLLAANGVDHESIIIIVSDHGDRTKSANPENYRVPLLVVGHGVRSGRDSGFRTHLDLPGIVTALMRGEPLPPERMETFLVGSTGRWVYGCMRVGGEYLFLDDATGRVMSSNGTIPPSDLAMFFQAYLDVFASRFGP